MPFVLGGAATGFSYFMFWKVVWGADVGKGVSAVLGNGIFSALAVSALYSPKYWWAGLYGGAFAGFLLGKLNYLMSLRVCILQLDSQEPVSA